MVKVCTNLSRMDPPPWPRTEQIKGAGPSPEPTRIAARDAMTDRRPDAVPLRARTSPPLSSPFSCRRLDELPVALVGEGVPLEHGDECRQQPVCQRLQGAPVAEPPHLKALAVSSVRGDPAG